MNINQSTPPSFLPPDPGSVHGLESTLLELNPTYKKKLKDIAKGVAEVAFSMGETNDVESYAQMMSEDLIDVIKRVKKKREKKKKR